MSVQIALQFIFASTKNSTEVNHKMQGSIFRKKLINNQVLLVQITASPRIVRTMHLLVRSLIEYSKKKSFYNPWNDGGFPYSMRTLAK